LLLKAKIFKTLVLLTSDLNTVTQLFKSLVRTTSGLARAFTGSYEKFLFTAIAHVQRQEFASIELSADRRGGINAKQHILVNRVRTFARMCPRGFAVRMYLKFVMDISDELLSLINFAFAA